MKTIEIKIQDEFDKLPDSFEKYTEIRITGNIERINKKFINGYISVSESAVIKYVYDSAVIQSVYDSAVIQYVYGSAVIQYVYDSAVIQSVYDSAVINNVSGSAVIKYVYGSAVIKFVSGSAVIKLMYENAKAILYSDSCKVLKALQQSIIICQDCRPKTNSKSNIPVIYTQKVKHDIESFFDIYGNGTNTITLYKSVNPNTRCDFYTDKIKYEGIVKCKDFDNNPDRECGGGLHLSPLPQLALNYNDGLLLKCEVNKSDIVVYHGNISKVRCRKVKVIGECDIDGNLIKEDTK